MCGWLSDETVLASRSKRARTSGFDERCWRQHLDRDLASEPRVAGAIHLAHAAGAERGDDLVGAEAGTGGEGMPGNLPYSRAARRPANRSVSTVREPLTVLNAR